jgi:hypothetical protein
MAEQSYATHRRFVTGYHFVLFPVAVAIFIGSIINLYKSWGVEGRFYDASLIAAMSLALIITILYARLFALKAQDRAILIEENLRHARLAGRPLDGRLTPRQIVGLRFASDEEFVALAQHAAEDGTSENDIKKSIRNWRGDFYRA